MKREFGIAGLSQLLGLVIRLVFTLGVIPIIISKIGTADYGRWAVINSQISLFAILDFGIATSTAYHIAKYYQKSNDEINSIISTSLIITVLIGLIQIVFYQYIYITLLHLNKNLNLTIQQESIIKITIFIKMCTCLQLSIENGCLKFVQQITIESICIIILYGGSIILTLCNFGLNELINWILINAIINFVIHFFYLFILLRRKFHFQFSIPIMRSLINYGFPNWLSSFGSAIFGQLDKIVVNFLLGAEISGVYSAASSIVTKITDISSSPIKVLPSIIRNSYSDENIPSIVENIFFQSTKLVNFFVTSISISIICWSKYIAHFVDPSHMIDLSRLLMIMAIIYGLFSFSSPSFYINIGIGSPQINAIWGIIGGISEILLMLILTPILGLLGATLSNTAYICITMISVQLIKSYNISIRTYFDIMKYPTLILVLCFSISFFSKIQQTSILIQAMYYILLCLAIFKLLTDKKTIRQIISNPNKLIMI